MPDRGAVSPGSGELILTGLGLMTTPIRVLIVDDEPLARRGVRSRLRKHSDIEIVAECATGKAAVTAIRERLPDLVFLDIQMPDISGFEVLRILKPDELPAVIFLTAYDQYALDAFSVHALDYLLKPIDDARFESALMHARETISNHDLPDLEKRIRELLKNISRRETIRYETRFSVRSGQRIAVVSVNDIDWIEACGDYVTLHVGNRSHLLRQTMNKMESQLDPARFLRIHRSTIVQTSRIRELVALDNREFLLRLSDGKELKTSRSYSDRIEKWL
ncbi:MAG TPA: LytTR family DNA-binding domain-containing protein [Candidatus Acidoferrum sp.]|nr:LytTR family DNA-binding domain-containing protein [Candidatus Acidoferrum sp.]